VIDDAPQRCRAVHFFVLHHDTRTHRRRKRANEAERGSCIIDERLIERAEQRILQE
jgi:hypothetical protein